MDLIIVDCQNDFVDGSLAAPNGVETVEKIVEFMKSKEDELQVYYTADSHPVEHMSFKDNGGIWPKHCVEGTVGADISEEFKNTKFIPDADNTYLKGRKSEVEEYSGFNSANVSGKLLKDALSDDIYIVGIASEYCVRETALAFKEFGKKVTVIKDLLGYIDYDKHLDNLKDLEDKGIGVI